MKKLFTLLATVTLSVMLFAQAPQSFSYQTVIRDASWQVLSNQNISLEISIIEDVANGTAIYTESHSATTNELGLVNLSIGDGGVMSGSWSNIDWGNHTYFIEVAVDVTGGTSYIVMGTTQLRSVPYALYAETSGSSTAGPQGAQGIQGIQGLPGDTGAVGPQGPIGLTGATGPAGNDGADGNDGAVGATGPAGVDGVDGVDGAVGATGPAGADGTNGADGNDGAPGIDGTNGVDGNDGAPGVDGTNGTNGVDGYTPIFGVDYFNGQDGIDGNDGAPGVDGTNGSDGAQGIQGPVGNDGVDGAPGADGVGIAQTLTISGDTLSISSGNSIVIPGLSLINSLIVQGCTDSTASNYNPLANTDDGSCCFYGCTDSSAVNYDTTATCDDGSCQFPVINIGEYRDGGVVFWVDGNGGGLVCDINDLGTSYWWGCGNAIEVAILGTAIGTGAQNTIDILNFCNSNNAAYKCDNNTGQGYTDWFLPSKDELNQMYVNEAAINATAILNGGSVFANDGYWSSSEVDSSDAWMQYFGTFCCPAGGQFGGTKSYNGFYVRAIRAF